MKQARRILYISTIFLALAVEAVAAERDCTLKPITSIDLIVMPGGAAIVPATLNGRRVGMMLRLDSIASLIDPVAAKEWALPLSKMPGDVHYGDLKIKQKAAYQDLAVGDIKYPPKGFFLVAPEPLNIPTVDGLQVIGSLSGSAFRGVDFELDLAHKKFTVYSQDHCPGQVVYWTDRYTTAPLLQTRFGAYFFPIELENKKLYATISYSRAVTTLGTDVSRALYGFDKSSAGIEENREADGTLYHYRAMNLTAAGVTLANARIRLVDPIEDCPLDKQKREVARYKCDGNYPLFLGGDVLQQLRLYFATKEGKLYFTSADAGMKQ
jgi:hypothetical protein